MQPTNSGGGGGLSRFRSAPATWLEALLESEEEDVIIDPPKPKTLTASTHPPPPPPVPLPHHQQSSIPGNTSRPTYVDPNMFSRQNSSPAEFFSQINNPNPNPDAYMSNYDDYLSTHVEQQPKFTTQLSGDQSALLDVEMDKFLGESVPCRVRAKRGCATHPRSIAERVRRTRISDRIRKLQELVPNMDKQTNTADMLEEAVEYVKFLQRQIQELRDHRDKCTCVVND